MKTKTSKQPNQSKPTVQLKDIKPKNNPTAGALAFTQKVSGEKQGGLRSLE